jgi:hypothetical protein
LHQSREVSGLRTTSISIVIDVDDVIPPILRFDPERHVIAGENQTDPLLDTLSLLALGAVPGDRYIPGSAILAPPGDDRTTKLEDDPQCRRS